jgi:hypothetical protein
VAAQGGLPTGGRVGPALPADPASLLDDQAPAPLPWALLPEQIGAHIALNMHVPVSTVLELSKEPGSCWPDDLPF